MNPDKALLEYRSTPLQVTGYAPCQLLMGRMLRTNLPVANAKLTPAWPDSEEVKKRDQRAKEKNAESYNRTHGARPLPKIPENAVVREKKGNDTQWSDPLLMKKQLSYRSYAIRSRRHLQHCPAIPMETLLQRDRNQPAAATNPTNSSTADTPRSDTSDVPRNVSRFGRVIKPVQRYEG